MASVDSLDDDRDTSLPTSALSPQEYRTFRTFVNDMDRTGIDNQVALHSVLEFLSTFKGVSQIVAQQVIPSEPLSRRLWMLFLDRSRVSLLGKATFML